MERICSSLFKILLERGFLRTRAKEGKARKIKGGRGRGGRPPPSANDEKEENAENVT